MLLAASCGGSKSSVKLQLSKSFAMVNNDFRGGIIIRGQGTVNDPTFTFDVGINNGDAIDIELPDDTYFLKVMAYETAAGSPAPFMGDPKCFASTVTINGSGSHEIQTTAANCNNSVFAGSTYRSGIGPKPLILHSCGNLESIGTPTTAINITTYNLCKNNYQPEIGRPAPYYRVSLLHQIDGVYLGTSTKSACTTTGTQTYKIPTAFPLTVETFHTADCSDTPKIYTFNNGFEGTGYTFTKIMANDTSQNFLAIANGPNGGTGIGNFHTESPMFTCGLTGYNKSCAKVMASGTSPALTIDRGPHFQRIRLPNSTMICGQSTSGFSGALEMKAGSCRTHNGKTYIEVRSSTAVTHSVTWNSIGFQIKAGNTTDVYGTNGSYSRERKLYQTLKSIIGYNFSSLGSHDASLQDDYWNDGKRSLGVLSEVSSLLSPYHLGTLFYGQGCSTVPLNSSIPYTLNYDSDFKPTEAVTAILTDPPNANPPSFTRNTDGPQGTNPSFNQVFHRRFILRTIPVAPALPKTFLTLDFSCENEVGERDFTSVNQLRIGRLERQFTHPDGTNTVSRKELLEYNVSRVHNSRFDYYNEKTIRNSSNVVLNFHKEFYRAEKFSGASDADFRISAVTYEAEKQTSNYIEYLNRFEIDGQYNLLLADNSNHRVYTFKEIMKLKKQNASIDDIFDENMFSEYMSKIYYGFEYNQSFANRDKQAQVASSPNGNFIQVWQTPGSLQMKAFNGAEYFNNSQSVTANFIAADMSPNGNYGVVAFSVGNNVYVHRFDNTLTPAAWSGTTLNRLTPNFDIVNGLKVAVKDNGTFVVGIIEYDAGNNDLLFLAEMNFGTTSFPSWDNTFGGETTREVYGLTLTKSSSQIFAGIASVDHMSGNSELHWCTVTTGANCSLTNDAEPDVVISGTTTAPFKHLQSSFGTNVEFSWVDTTMNARKLVVDTSMVRTGEELSSDYFVQSYEINSITSYYDIQLQIVLSTYANYGHAHVPVPYTQPSQYNSGANFRMNFNSLNPTNFSQVFTTAGPFESTVGVP